MMSTSTRLLVAGFVALTAGTAAHAQQPAPHKPAKTGTAPHDTAKHTPTAAAQPHAKATGHSGKKKKAPTAAPSKP